VLRDIAPGSAASLQAVVLVDAPQQALPDRLLDRPVLRFDLDRLPEPATASSTTPATADDPDAPSILFTTSGTTSGPKLVVHSQRSIAAHLPHVATAFGFQAPDAVLLAALPFNGVFGFVATLAAFVAARPAVLMPTFDADEAVALVQRHAVTHCFGSDEMFELMLERVPQQRPLPTLRVCGYAAFRAGAMAFAAQARQRGLPLRGLYGSSEVQALFSVQPEGLGEAELIEGGGRPVQPAAQVRVRDVDTGELLPPGRSGALEIRALGNFIGYLNNPQATAAATTADGFFRTGDLGRLRDDGSFVYETRQGDAIRLAGYLVAPAEIEEVLKQAPDVAAAQVVAVEIAGKTRAVAFVIAAPGAICDEAALIAHAGARLAAYKLPARVWPVDSFPVVQSANGTKIQRNRLREMALERLAAG
jgi:fatty-acyl-CoA synthase